jgi:ABC-2 type transport system permease protein
MEIGFGNDLRQIGVVTRYEILRHIRSKKLYVLAAFVILIFVLYTAVYLYTSSLSTDPKALIVRYLGPVSLFVIIGVSLFCASTIASEFEERTALLVFPRPMKRTVLFIGKALACYIVCGGVIVLYYVMCMVLSLLNTGSVYPAAFASLGLTLLFMLSVGGFALLMSSLFKRGLTAVIVTVLLLILVFWMMVDNGLAILISIEPLYSPTYAGASITNVINGLVTYSETMVMPDVPTLTITYHYPTNGTAIATMTVWATVTTTLAALLFRRKEF